MPTSLLPVRSTLDQRNLRNRLSIILNESSIFKIIDDDPGLIGAGVIFIDHRGTIVVLREFEPICSVKPVNVVLREPPRQYTTNTYIAEVRNTDREGRLLYEATGASLSCGAAVIGWIVVIGFP